MQLRHLKHFGMSPSRWTPFLLALGVFVLVTGSMGAYAQVTHTIGAGGTYATITAAEAAAGAGDTLQIVDTATYSESFALTKALTLTSTAAGPTLPRINGQIDVQAPGVVISNVQIQNSGGHGVAMLTDLASVDISGCDLSGGSANAIFIDASTTTVTVTGCAINGNGGYGLGLPDPGTDPRNTGNSVTIDQCQMLANGVGWGIGESDRGRAIDWSKDDNGSLTVTNTNITVTDDGASDRAISVGGRFVDFTMDNVTISAPIYDEITGLGNKGFAIITNDARDCSFDFNNLTTNGFWEISLRIEPFDTNNIDPSAINCRVTNSQFLDFGSHVQHYKFQYGTSEWVNCTFRGGYDDGTLKFQQCYGANVTVTNCTMQDGLRAVYLRRTRDNDSYTFTNCIMKDCEAGIRMRDCDDNGGTVLVENCEIRDNDYGFLMQDGHKEQEVTIRNSDFLGNGTGVQLDHTGENCEIAIEGCLFLQNAADAPTIFANDNPMDATLTLTNCTIHGAGTHGIHFGPTSQVKGDMSLCIIGDWNNTGVNIEGGTFDEDFNVYVDEDIATQGAFASAAPGVLTQGGGSATSDDLSEVYCQLLDFASDYLYIDANGPAYAIDGSNNAGAKPECPPPPSAVENWNLFE